jgi:HSP20 family protein
MRRNGELFPVRRDQDWTRGLSPWGDSSLFAPSSFFNTFGASPWQAMRRMQEDMDRLFSQLVVPEGAQGLGQGLQQWAPSVDVSQDDKEWLVEVDLPGVKKDDIDVQVYQGHLILRAELRQESPHEPAAQEGAKQGPQRQYHRRERRYGYFERVVPLPQNVDDEQIRCEFRDGVLKVHIPRLPEQRPTGRKIAIGDSPEAPQASLGARTETSAAGAVDVQAQAPAGTGKASRARKSGS